MMKGDLDVGAFSNVRASVESLIRTNQYRLSALLHASHVQIGSHAELRDVELSDWVNIAHHASVTNSVVGKRTSIGRYSKIRSAIIGSYCSISWDVTIGAVMHPLSRLTTHAFPYIEQFGLGNVEARRPDALVTIGNDVWIGCNSVILPGVNIGDGAVIGASAVITRDVEPFAIMAGVPARKLRDRFDSTTAKQVEEMAWWDWPDEELREKIDMFRADYPS